MNRHGSRQGDPIAATLCIDDIHITQLPVELQSFWIEWPHPSLIGLIGIERRS